MIDYYGHISAEDAVLSFDAPSFAQLVSDELGNAGSPSDGFDSTLLQAYSDLDALANLIDFLDGVTDVTLGLNDVLSENPLAAETPLLESNLADLAADLGGFITVTAPVGITPPADSGTPAPPAQPAPARVMREMVTVTGPVRACSGSEQWPTPGSVRLPYTVTLGLTNNGPNAIDTTAWRFVCPKPGAFTCKYDAPDTLQVGTTWQLSVTQNIDAVAGDEVQIFFAKGEHGTDWTACYIVAQYAGGGTGATGGSLPPSGGPTPIKTL